MTLIKIVGNNMLDEVIKKLKKMTASELRDMAESIDVSFDYLLSIKYGEERKPMIKTVLKIKSHLELL